MRPRDTARSTRLVVAVFAAVLLLVGIAGVVLLRTTGVGSGGLSGAGDRLEEWIGGQLTGIANAYLVPQLAYSEIDYRWPGEVTLGGVTFTAPDGTRVLELESMSVTLAEVPKIGEPIVIQNLSLARPTVRLLREHREDGSSGFKGLSPIVRHAPGADEEVPEEFRLSSVLRLRRIDIAEGTFVYDAGDGSPPMTLAGLTTTVQAAPDEGEPGWYALDIRSAVGPLAELTVEGLLSLDTLVGRFDQLRFAGEISPQSAGALPPPLQELIAAHEARGRVEISASGTLPLTDAPGADLRIDVRLSDLSLASGEYELSIDAASCRVSLSAGRATLLDGRAETLGGLVEASADADLTATGIPATVAWTIEGVDLAELLRADPARQGPPPLAGMLAGSGSAAMDLASPRASLDGAGELRVREGTLSALPSLRRLAALLQIATGNLLRDALHHRADVSFGLGPAGFDVTSLEITTDSIGVRGSGTISFEGALDLSVNAGPLEKVQSLLGLAGDVLGAVTDRLVKYRIRGTVGDPQVTVDPLGVGG